MSKASCEPGRRSAYGEDLRWRIVWQREVLGYKYGQIASNLNVDVSTVWRIVRIRDALIRESTQNIEPSEN